MFPGRSRRSRRASTCSCEKPVALDAGEAETLIAARDKAGRLVAEAFMVRHHPQWRRARELARSGAIGEVRAIQTFFSYRLLDPENVRNRPPGGGGLYDIGCYAIVTARYMFGAEPTRVVATLDRDPNFGTDRLASAILEFPGGRHLTFSAATQLSAHQRVTIVGEAGRIEIAIPFNALPDRPMRIVIDPGADLVGGGARVEEFPVSDQYGLQGDAFARAVRGEAPLEFGIEDAVHEHARDRSAVPLGRARELGDAVAPRPACVAVASLSRRAPNPRPDRQSSPHVAPAEPGPFGLRRLENCVSRKVPENSQATLDLYQTVLPLRRYAENRRVSAAKAKGEGS